MAATLHLQEVQLETAADRVELSARVSARRLGWHGERLWFRLPRELAPQRPHGDPFAVALLLPAMAARADLIVEAALSPSLAANLAKVQELVVGWNRRNPWARLRPVRLVAERTEEAGTGSESTGLFFTGGVDSLYSLLHAVPAAGRAVDALLYVEGYDVPLGATALAASVSERLHRAAREAGLPLLTVETNLRQFTDPALSWDMAHGSALAAAGHALGAHFGRWYVSSADAYVSGAVYGTAQRLDPLWSREGLAFQTLGAGVDRLTKLAALVDEPLARRHLTVCWQPRPSAFNCGRCAKCVRTMLQLLVLDALDGFETLPHDSEPLRLGVDSILAEPMQRLFLWEELARRLGERPEWRALAEAVEALTQRSRRVDRFPRPWSLASREGRRLGVEWIRRRLQPRLPVGLRRRLRAVRRRLGGPPTPPRAADSSRSR